MDADDATYLFEIVRQRFDIEFDSYADEAGTVGDLYKYVLWKLGLRQREEACLCTIPFAVHIPKSCATVGGLAEEATKLNYGRTARENDSLHPDEVWSVLRDLVAEAAGTQPENVRKDMPLWDAPRAVANPRAYSR